MEIEDYEEQNYLVQLYIECEDVLGHYKKFAPLIFFNVFTDGINDKNPYVF